MIYFGVANPLDWTSPENPREPRRNGTVLVFFSPAGDGICLVLEATSQDHGDMGFVPGSATGTVKNTLTGTMADV